MEKQLMIYINGEIVPEEDAKISVFDRSFLYGDGCFEGIGVNGSRVNKLNEHVNRLYRSAKSIHIKIPLKKEEMKEAILDTLRANRDNNINYLRPIISRGSGPLGLIYTKTVLNPGIVIIPQRRKVIRKEEGMRLKTSPMRKVPPQCLDPRSKLNQYLGNVLAYLAAQDAGADDALLLDTGGYVAEGTAFNLFVVSNGALHTPETMTILAGITRDTVIKVARDNGIPVYERKLTLYDIYQADEVFITGSLSGVRAVKEVDGYLIADGKPGELTRKLHQLYLEDCAETSTPF